MQTRFSIHQLADPKLAEAERIIRSCVHCGFCTATCPTYVLLGNELDSPRGRIYLIKEMLENERPADIATVTHIDRCLSCLSCLTTCPSGVHYMHLVDQARIHIEKTHERPLPDRLVRAALAQVLPYPSRLRLALRLGRAARPFRRIIARFKAMNTVATMLELLPAAVPETRAGKAQRVPGKSKGRVALMSGCVQQVIGPQINASASALLARLGVEAIAVQGEGCCGALVHHMGQEEQALAHARRNVDAWMREVEDEGLDAILVTASGCGTTVKDYGHMLRLDPQYAEKAARISALAMDISEYIAKLSVPDLSEAPRLRVAYHSACSLQHGQRIVSQPQDLLRKAGFELVEPAESHLCCGSAGTYNLLQPELAGQLGQRKARNLEKTGADIIATGNIGCMTQIAGKTGIPVVHTVQLLDWAWGGEQPGSISV